MQEFMERSGERVSIVYVANWPIYYKISLISWWKNSKHSRCEWLSIVSKWIVAYLERIVNNNIKQLISGHFDSFDEFVT